MLKIRVSRATVMSLRYQTCSFTPTCNLGNVGQMIEFVANYRRSANINGKLSYSNLYTSISVLAGHYASYGPKFPVPEKRRKRLLQVMYSVNYDRLVYIVSPYRTNFHPCGEGRNCRGFRAASFVEPCRIRLTSAQMLRALVCLPLILTPSILLLRFAVRHQCCAQEYTDIERAIKRQR